MKLQDLLQERGQVATQMRAMHKAAEDEERGFSSDEQSKWEEMTTTLEGFDKRIETSKRASSLDEFTQEQREEKRLGKQEQGKEQSKEERAREAFGALIRSDQPGSSGLSAEHQAALVRAQSVGTNSAGGYLVPTDLQKTIIEKMVQFGGIRNLATVISTDTGNTLDIPTNDDTGNSGAILAENAQDSEQDVAFGSAALGAYKYTSKIIRVPIELMQDSAFNLEAFLIKKFGERLGRATAAHYAAGTGSSQPQGLNQCTSGKTAAAVAAVTYIEMLDLKHSVDPAYRIGANWVFNDTTLLALKKLLDGDSRPLWQPDISGVTPATIDGDTYAIDQGLPNMAASAKSIVYGDISGLWIRDVMGMAITRMVERYADYHQVGFVAIMRTDSKIIDGNGMRALTMAAS